MGTADKLELLPAPALLPVLQLNPLLLLSRESVASELLTWIFLALSRSLPALALSASCIFLSCNINILKKREIKAVSAGSVDFSLPETGGSREQFLPLLSMSWV